MPPRATQEVVDTELLNPPCHHRLFNVLAMVSVKISPAGRPLPLARGLPLTVEVKDDAKISDVKTAVEAKFPKVGQIAYLYVSRIGN